jgi:outer membrane protein TolC
MYQYTRRDEAITTESLLIPTSPPVTIPVGVARARDEFDFSATVSQPLFAGFSLLNQYRLSSLGLDAAKINEQLLRQDVIFDVKRAYYSILKAEKLVTVAEQTIEQIEAQKSVAENFYEVGMSPLNDLLQAQVELANARQALIRARNALDLAHANFNNILRRPINLPVFVEDIQSYRPFDRDVEDCLRIAEKSRLEIKIAALDVQIAEKEVALTKKDYFPTVNLEGTYYRAGTDWDVDGGTGISDPEGWYISAVASWNFWEWGRTQYDVSEKRHRLARAELQKEQISDTIRLEVKDAFLRTREAERNILTVKKAIEQAKENYRINQERYNEQVATATEVLIAQTLLTDTMTNYYNALYDFKISEAALYRAMGLEESAQSGKE